MASANDRALDDLVATVSVTEIGPDRFTGVGSTSDGVEATYGGHFLAQATSAALATVEPDRRLHSMHGYFVRAGRPGEPYQYSVERVRDGRSFCTRRVSAFQDDGKVQFELLASCCRMEDGPVLAAEPPPDFEKLPAPESLANQRDLMASLDELPLPEAWALRPNGLDIRTVNAPWAPDGPSDDGGIRLWVKAAGPLPDDHHLNAAVLAYQSDESLADNIAIPWGATWGTPGVVFVSLDHVIWIHRPFSFNRWLFIDQRPVTVGHGRGLSTAQVWTEDGQLVASFTQEALLRLSDDYLANRSDQPS